MGDTHKETGNTISFDILGSVYISDHLYFVRRSFIESPTTLTISSSQKFTHQTKVYHEVGGEYIETDDGYEGFLWWRKKKTVMTYSSKYKTVDLLKLDDKEYITRFYDE